MNQSNDIIEQLKREEESGLLSLENNRFSYADEQIDQKSINNSDDNIYKQSSISFNKTNFFDLISLLSDWNWKPILKENILLFKEK